MIIELEQGSGLWLDWRRTKRMASESPVVTRRSPYQSWTGLRDIKRGASTQQTAAMAHGHAYEHEARMWAAAETGHLFEPVCVEKGDYAASLDGIDGSSLVEIKCPFKGRESDTWKFAERGLISPLYDDQVIHQLEVSGAEVCYFAVYDAATKRGILIERRPDVEAWKKLAAQWDEFWAWHLTDDPDPAKNLRTDADWIASAALYAASKRQADYYAKIAEEQRARLLELSGGVNAEGAGVKVSVFSKAGGVDYKRAIAELAKDADLEPYRKAGTTEARITLN